MEFSFDVAAETVNLTVTQTCHPTPGQPSKRPFLIPCAVGLLHPKTGVDILPEPDGTVVLRLTEPTQSFILPAKGCGAQAPVLSFLRQFSAPVRAHVVGRTVADTAFIMRHDSDSYNQWAAAQALAVLAIVDSAAAESARSAYLTATAALLNSVLIEDRKTDLALVAAIATVPSTVALEDAVYATGATVDPVQFTSSGQRSSRQLEQN